MNALDAQGALDVTRIRLRYDRNLRAALTLNPGTAWERLAASVPKQEIDVGPLPGAAVSEVSKNEFEARGYTVIRGLVPSTTALALAEYARAVAHGERCKPDDQVEGTPAVYGDPAMDQLLEKLRPAMEAYSGRSLNATYTYFRVYKNGDVLKRHKDRAACEISCSLALGYSMPEPWLFYAEGPLGASAARLEPGDALLYKGMEVPHWRDALEGEWVAQVFLHYVDRNGPHADLRLDGRTELGVPKFVRREA